LQKINKNPSNIAHDDHNQENPTLKICILKANRMNHQMEFNSNNKLHPECEKKLNFKTSMTTLRKNHDILAPQSSRHLN
jgi:hypothetical protein